MRNIGFTDKEVEQVLNTVVAILLLGNIEFDKVHKAAVGDVSQVNSDSIHSLAKICAFLGLNLDKLTKALTFKKQVIGRDVIEINLNQDEAYNCRDSMAKSIYGKLFNWLVERIN